LGGGGGVVGGGGGVGFGGWGVPSRGRGITFRPDSAFARQRWQWARITEEVEVKRSFARKLSDLARKIGGELGVRKGQ